MGLVFRQSDATQMLFVHFCLATRKFLGIAVSRGLIKRIDHLISIKQQIEEGDFSKLTTRSKSLEKLSDTEQSDVSGYQQY